MDAMRLVLSQIKIHVPSFSSFLPVEKCNFHGRVCFSLFLLVRADPALGVRADGIRPAIAVGGLVAIAELEAVDPGGAAAEGLFARAGLRRVGDQLLQGAAVGRELQGLETLGVAAGVVVDVVGGRGACAVCVFPQGDHEGLGGGDEAGGGDEGGEKGLHCEMRKSSWVGKTE